MTGTVGSAPCGACKFLRRKCVSGCVFAPYFCHEQGAAHFAAVHKVFGASNASKLLSRLPIGLRGEAAVTISYEAQARLQDPIYGCISHIFVLEKQVVSLQTQLACLKQQTSLTNQATSSTSPNAAKFNGELFSSSSSSSTNSSSAYSSYPQDVHSWLHSGYPDIVMQQFTQNRFVDDSPLFENHVHELETHNSYDREYSADLQEEDNGSTTTTFQCSSSSSIPPAVEPYYYGHNDYSQTWPAAYHHNMADDLHSVAFGHTQLGV